MYGKKIIVSHTHTIAKILLMHLRSPHTLNELIPQLLSTISKLYWEAQSTMICYNDEIFPILISMMKDKS
jgi:hypothetical protein